MQPDLLQQLRDIHLPIEPLWWPPAPGWWLLLVAALAALGWLVMRFRARLARRRPIKMARALYLELHAAYLAGSVDAASYLHASNELLKRMFIHGLAEPRARKANDDDWLALLDERMGGDRFAEGAGRQLGNQRFRSQPEADVDSLHPLLLELFEAALRRGPSSPGHARGGTALHGGAGG